MGRKYDTIGSSRAKSRLSKHSVKYVTQLEECINTAYKVKDWPLFLDAVRIALDRTIPKLTSIEATVDNKHELMILTRIEELMQLPDGNAGITTVKVLNDDTSEAADSPEDD